MSLLDIVLLVVIILLTIDNARLRMADNVNGENLPERSQKNANADVVHPKPLPPELTDAGVGWDSDTIEDEE